MAPRKPVKRNPSRQTVGSARKIIKGRAAATQAAIDKALGKKKKG